MEEAYLGLDIGGTRVRALLLSRAGRTIAEDSCPSLGAEGARRVLVSAINLGADLAYKSAVRVAGVGACAPGGFDREGVSVAEAANIPGWKGLALAGELARAFGAPAAAVNDAAAAALGEKEASRSTARTFALVSVGTGLGAGVVVDGAPLADGRTLAGEIGHLVVERGGRPCPCGNSGCAEAYASGTGIARSLRELAFRHDSPLARRARAGEALRAEDAYADLGDPLAAEAHDLACEMLARAVAALAVATAPEELALGGGLGASEAPLLEGLAARLGSLCLPPLAAGIRLRRAAHPNPGALGAALCAARAAASAPARDEGPRAGRGAA